MCNYGSPLVGNGVFADEFNKLVPDAWRVVHEDDIVPWMPRGFGYKHVGRAAWLRHGQLLDVDVSGWMRLRGWVGGGGVGRVVRCAHLCMGLDCSDTPAHPPASPSRHSSSKVRWGGGAACGGVQP